MNVVNKHQMSDENEEFLKILGIFLQNLELLHNGFVQLEDQLRDVPLPPQSQQERIDQVNHILETLLNEGLNLTSSGN